MIAVDVRTRYTFQFERVAVRNDGVTLSAAADFMKIIVTDFCLFIIFSADNEQARARMQVVANKNLGAIFFGSYR